MSSLRILHVIPYFRPAFGFGGPATITDLLTSGLAEAGCEVSVWTSNVLDSSGARLTPGKETANAVTTYRYSYFIRPLFRAMGLLVTPRMMIDALLPANGRQIVHLHDYRSFQAVCAYWYAKRQGIPLMLQPHGTLKIALGKERLKRFYDAIVGRRILSYISRVIVLSAKERDEARLAGIPDGRISVVANGVPVPSSDEKHLRGGFRKQHDIHEDALLVLFMGRVRESKGVFLLLDAFILFTKLYPNSVLAICGPDDGAASEVTSRAANAGTRVVMPGLLTGTHKAAAFIDSDVFCLTSQLETQSVAILEAASYGLPIIAGKTSAPPEFIEAKAGLFVELREKDIAEAFTQVAQSASRRHELGSRAKVIVRDYYSAERQVSSILGLYRAVLRESRQSGASVRSPPNRWPVLPKSQG